MGGEGYNPRMLSLAREALGLSQSALAKVLGCGQPRVSRVEDGSLKLTGQELVEWLAAVQLSTPLAAYEGDATAPTLSFYRKTKSIPIGSLTAGNARIMLRRAEILMSLKGKSLTCKRQIPHFAARGVVDAIDAARRVKQKWGIPEGPVHNLIRWVEEAGCVVEWFQFGIPKIDAVALGGPIPVIFLNPSFPPDRIRLSLAHELGHQVMHRELHEKVEDEAWAFASEFLMPEIDIRPELYPLDIEHLLNLKIRWQVSMQALLKRAKDLDRISDRYSQFLWMRLGQYGFRKEEPGREKIQKEEPTPLSERLQLSAQTTVSPESDS
jgi:Zn-dependent peptidase ImmA (M78 family)/transcriptional regulator with XRE-family HTH domain